MELITLLTFLLTAGGAGAATWGLIEFLNKVLPVPLSSTVKFYLAMLLAFVLPCAAYAVEVYAGIADFGADGLLAAITVGYLVSQTIHRDQEQKARITSGVQ